MRAALPGHLRLGGPSGQIRAYANRWLWVGQWIGVETRLIRNDTRAKRKDVAGVGVGLCWRQLEGRFSATDAS